MYTYAELFAGAGGMSLGLDAGGFHALAHAEIEPHACAVLRNRWPSVRLDGDVTQINGADYAGITLLSGGSPCQDLSVAGKRAGLIGSRSSLFHEQCRIWRESGAPYLLWENVLGALSSNNGRDFATVLSTIVGSTVAVPADGWRGGGGVVAGRDAVAAFRVLDLQHFGPPQRRVRVFVLAARTGGVDPAEVLALSEGVCGHPSPRQQSRKRIASRVGGGAESGGVTAAFNYLMGAKAHGIGWAEKQSSTLLKEMVPGVIAWDNAVALNISNGIPSLDDTMGTLDTDGASTTAIGNQTRGVVIALHHTQTPISGEVSPAIGRTTGGMAVVSFAENERAELRMSDVTQSLTSGGGKPGQGYAAVLCTTGGVPHAATGLNGDEVLGALLARGDSSPCVDRGQPAVIQASKDGTGHGTPIVSVFVDPGMESWKAAAVIEPMCARDYKDAAAIVVGNSGMESWKGRIRAEAGRPRRLTPLECERLMSWPDQWTATGTKDDGIEYLLSDTARYRLCGNGVGSVCAEWIARRLYDAITAAESAA